MCTCKHSFILVPRIHSYPGLELSLCCSFALLTSELVCDIHVWSSVYPKLKLITGPVTVTTPNFDWLMTPIAIPLHLLFTTCMMLGVNDHSSECPESKLDSELVFAKPGDHLIHSCSHSSSAMCSKFLLSGSLSSNSVIHDSGIRGPKCMKMLV